MRFYGYVSPPARCRVFVSKLGQVEAVAGDREDGTSLRPLMSSDEQAFVLGVQVKSRVFSRGAHTSTGTGRSTSNGARYHCLMINYTGDSEPSSLSQSSSFVQDGDRMSIWLLGSVLSNRA